MTFDNAISILAVETVDEWGMLLPVDMLLTAIKRAFDRLVETAEQPPTVIALGLFGKSGSDPGGSTP